MTRLAALKDATAAKGIIGKLYPPYDGRIVGAALLAIAMVASVCLVVPTDHVAPDLAPVILHASALHAEAQSTAFGGQSQRPATVVSPVSCEKLPNAPGKSITTAVVAFPPGAYSPRHRHPGSVMAFVLKGTLRSQLEGGPVGTYTVGQTWFEPPGMIHLFAENASPTDPAELLAIFVTDEDCGPLTIPDEDAAKGPPRTG